MKKQSGSQSTGSGTGRLDYVINSRCVVIIALLSVSILFSAVEGGVCWENIENSMCSSMFDSMSSYEDCCGSNSPGVGFTDGHFDRGEIFRMSYLQLNNECRSCKRTCSQLRCDAGQVCDDTSGQARCVCPTLNCNSNHHSRRVCATNGQTYDNECHFLSEKCREGGHLEIDYLGRCRHSCDRVRCPDSKSCVMDSNYGKPHCVQCLPVSGCPDAVDRHGPICGADGVTYNNMCQFSRATCHQGRSIGIAYMGRPCDSSLTCDDITCQTPQQRCLWNRETQMPQCFSCGTNCQVLSLPQNSVCGSDNRSYRTSCELREEACRSGEVITTKHRGRCGHRDHLIDHLFRR